MSGFDNEVLYADNVDFRGVSPVVAQMTADGQLLIGATAAPNIRASTLTAGAGISITNGAGSITITNTGGGGGGGLTTLAADSGAATELGGVITVTGNTGLTTTGVLHTLTISPANDLAALENLTGTGFSARIGVETWALRTFQPGTGISISNPAGVAGDPTISAAASVATTYTADTGSATPIANNLNLVGSGSITTSGAAATITTQLTGLTNHAVLVGAGTTTITKLAVGTNGQVLIAATAADPAFATISSSNNSISFTLGANTLDMVVNSSTVAQTITGDSGGILSPTLGNWNLLGSGSITTSGAGSTLTTQLTGLTNHAVLVGAGTTTITKVGPTATSGQVLQSAGAAADPAFSTATYPATTTINQLLYSSSNNVVAGLTAANQSVLTSGTSGIPVWTSVATNGQLIIGSTAGAPAAATLTQGTGITITNASNSITIAVSGSVVGQTITGDSGGGLSPSAGNWNIIGGPGVTTTGSGSTLTINSITFTDTTAATLAVDNGYFATAAGAYTLPAAPAQGEMVIIFCDTTGAVAVTANTGHIIRIGSSVSSSAGTATSTARGDSLTLRFRTSGSVWACVASMGNWTLA